MKIENSMNLNELMACMGNTATASEAAIMRDLLIEHFNGQNTLDIIAEDWLNLLNVASVKAQ